MSRDADPQDALLTPGQVARMFGVNPKTITRWASGGKLTPIRTLGGHRRYRASQVRGLLDGATSDDAEERNGDPVPAA